MRNLLDNKKVWGVAGFMLGVYIANNYDIKRPILVPKDGK